MKRKVKSVEALEKILGAKCGETVYYPSSILDFSSEMWKCAGMELDMYKRRSHFTSAQNPDCASDTVWAWTEAWLEPEAEAMGETELPSADDYDRAATGMAAFLRAKNQHYGDSVNNPVQVFGPKMEQDAAFFVRMNDKLSRIMNGPDEPRMNDIVDLEGYLMLYRIRQGWLDLSSMID